MSLGGDGKAMRSILILGSSGRQGSTLAKRLSEDGYSIIGADRIPCTSPHHRFVQVDLSQGAFETLPLSDVDTVIFALPARLATKICAEVARALPRDALVVDLLSEKSPFVEEIESVSHVRHMGIHLLFSPSVDWKDQNAVATLLRDPDPRASEFLECLRRWGCKVHFTDPVEHDRLMGLVQVGVHAAVIGYATLLRNSGLSFGLLQTISTPASRVMWAMIARIVDNDPDVYWEIQSENRISRSIRDQFADALNQLTRAVVEEDKGWFDELFEDLTHMMDYNRNGYNDLAHTLYDSSAEVIAPRS